MRSLIHELTKIVVPFIFFFNVHMKTFKKLFAYSAIFALLATMMPTYANAASYDAELTEAYGYAKNKWITTMASIDDADMYGNLTRVAMAKMVANYVLDLGLQELDTTKECKFPDVSEALDAAYDNGVTKACQLGLMGVGIEKFNPNGIVTRAEFGTVLSRALWGDEYNDATPYYKAHLEALKAEGIMTKIDNPNMKEVRGYVMLMMMRADEDYTPAVGCSAEEVLACLIADDPDACIAACSDEDAEEVILPGHATVSLVSKAADQYVPYDAVNVKVGTIKLTAGENDTKVSSVEVTRSWLADASRELKLMLSNASLQSSTATIKGTSEKTSIRFSPAIELKWNSSMEFDLIVNIETGSNNDVHSFAVTSMVVANGTASGMPISLGIIKTTPAATKTVDVEVTSPDKSLKAGDTKKTIAKLNVDFNKAGGTLNGFVLTADTTGKVNEAFDNVEAYVDGKIVWKTVITKDKVIVSNLNISKERLEEVDVEIKANVVFIWKDANFKFQVNEQKDFSAIEKDSNFGMKLKGWANSGTVTIPNSDTVTIQGYDLRIKPVAIKENKLVPWERKVLLYTAEITAATNLLLNNFELTASSGDVVSGAIVDESLILKVGWEEFQASQTWYVVEENAWINIVAWRTVVVEVIWDIRTEATDSTIYFNFEIIKIEDEDEVETTPSANNKATWTSISIKNSELSVTKLSATTGSKKIHSDAANQEIGRFSLKSVQDVLKLSSIKMSAELTWEALSGTNIEDFASINNIKLIIWKQEVSANVDGTGLTFNLSDLSDEVSISKTTAVEAKVVATFTSVNDYANNTLTLTVQEAELKNSVNKTVDYSKSKQLDTYNFGNKAPELSVSFEKWGKYRQVFAVTIENEETENVTLSGLNLRVNATYEAGTGILFVATDPEANFDDEDVLSPNALSIPTSIAGSTVSLTWDDLELGIKTIYVIIDSSNELKENKTIELHVQKVFVGNDDFSYNGKSASYKSE